MLFFSFLFFPFFQEVRVGEAPITDQRSAISDQRLFSRALGAHLQSTGNSPSPVLTACRGG